MKQQVVIIHGGSTFDSYKEFLSYLKEKEIKLDRLKGKSDWKTNLPNELGGDYEVLLPFMPNKANAKYVEWEIWFDKIVPFLKRDVILLGHSMGGIFLAKYLSEHQVGKKIKAVILVSAPYDDESQESLGDFKISSSLERFEKQAGEIFLIQSKDDPVVSEKELEKYKKALSDAKVIALPRGGHFNEDSFPELLKLLKSL